VKRENAILQSNELPKNKDTKLKERKKKRNLSSY
jgi:hypothetical protein